MGKIRTSLIRIFIVLGALIFFNAAMASDDEKAERFELLKYFLQWHLMPNYMASEYHQKVNASVEDDNYDQNTSQYASAWGDGWWGGHKVEQYSLPHTLRVRDKAERREKCLEDLKILKEIGCASFYEIAQANFEQSSGTYTNQYDDDEPNYAHEVFDGYKPKPETLKEFGIDPEKMILSIEPIEASATPPQNFLDHKNIPRFLQKLLFSWHRPDTIVSLFRSRPDGKLSWEEISRFIKSNTAWLTFFAAIGFTLDYLKRGEAKINPKKISQHAVKIFIYNMRALKKRNFQTLKLLWKRPFNKAIVSAGIAFIINNLIDHDIVNENGYVFSEDCYPFSGDTLKPNNEYEHELEKLAIKAQRPWRKFSKTKKP